MSKKLVATFIILIVVCVIGLLGFWYWHNTFSQGTLKLEISGPQTAAMGEEITYTITYRNTGNFVLQSPKLVFQLPDNSLTEDSQLRLEKSLGDISPGQQESLTFKARLLGKEGESKTTRASFSYTPQNLSARYESDATFVTKIDSVPLTLTLDVPTRLEKGKEINYAINYFSNIDYPLENLSIKVDAVNGFNLESADPTSLDNIEWRLDTLQKAQGGRIAIKGLINGDVGNHVLFSVHLGMWRDGTFVVIKDATADIEVISPSLSISEKINGRADYVASPGELLHYEIFIKNTSDSVFDNSLATAKLSGSAFDFSTLASSGGRVRLSDNSVTWDAGQIPALAHLASNQETSVAFDVKLKTNWNPFESEKNNALIKNSVTVSDVNQGFSNKVNSNLQVSQKAYFKNVQGFPLQADMVNSGPTPPQVGSSTTYTVSWQVKNYVNDVKNVKVRALLPQGVTLTSKMFPATWASYFSYDNNSREIVWTVGDILAGGGVNASVMISFQITLNPTIAMQGRLAALINQATITGEDQFTGNIIFSTVPAVNTDLPDDAAGSGGGTVQ